MKLSLTGRIVLTVLCFGIAFVGFMVKLPGVFRHHDTELHTLFYFLAAAFLNVLFVKRNLAGHVLVFGLLYGMGVGVEYAQEYSNSFGQRIHGNYDPEDIRANLKGLVAFSVLWVVYVIGWYATRSTRPGIIKPALPSKDVFKGDAVRDNLQSDISTQGLPDPQDEEKLRVAIQLLTEIINKYPDHPLSAKLRETTDELRERFQQG